MRNTYPMLCLYAYLLIGSKAQMHTTDTASVDHVQVYVSVRGCQPKRLNEGTTAALAAALQEDVHVVSTRQYKAYKNAQTNRMLYAADFLRPDKNPLRSCMVYLHATEDDRRKVYPRWMDLPAVAHGVHRSAPLAIVTAFVQKRRAQHGRALVRLVPRRRCFPNADLHCMSIAGWDTYKALAEDESLRPMLVPVQRLRFAATVVRAAGRAALMADSVLQKDSMVRALADIGLLHVVPYY